VTIGHSSYWTALVSSSDYELWTNDLDVARVKVNQHAKYAGQRSSTSKVTTLYAHTDTRDQLVYLNY